MSLNENENKNENIRINDNLNNHEHDTISGTDITAKSDADDKRTNESTPDLPDVMNTSSFVIERSQKTMASGNNPRMVHDYSRGSTRYSDANPKMTAAHTTTKETGGLVCALRNLKIWQKILISAGAVVIVVGAAYGIGNVYWADRFYPNTHVGTVDLSGKTFSEADAIEYSAPDDIVLTVTDSAIGTKDEITKNDIGVSYDYSGALSALKQEHTSALWFIDMMSGAEHKESPNASYDNEAVDAAIDELDCMTADRTEPVNASLQYENGSFSIKQEQQGTTIDVDKLKQAIRDAISNGQSTLEISDLEIYTQPSITSSSQELVSAMEQGQNMLNAEVTFTDGDSSKTITRDDIASWIYIADDGVTIDVNRDGVAEWMRELGKEYDTAGKDKQFTTTNGNTITVSGGDYGWITDEATMVDQAIESIKSGQPQTLDIAWQQTAASHGDKEWGDTYVEVSIADQHIWCYKDGELALSCDVVTGKPDGKHETSTGMYTIKMMAHPWVMTGADENGDGEPDYRTPCDYFILWTNTGIAFHDATWQSAFGGQRYKQGYGSHGCVNMSYSTVQQLWDLVENGDPVICY